MPKRRDRDELLNDRLPIDVLPYSNEEFIPGEPTAKQKAITLVAREACEEAARKHGLSRRRFLQTGAAYGVCLWAINRVMGGGYALAGCPDGLSAPIGQKGVPTDIPLDFPGAQLQNLPGEFIFDLQNHAMDAGASGGSRTRASISSRPGRSAAKPAAPTSSIRCSASAPSTT